MTASRYWSLATAAAMAVACSSLAAADPHDHHHWRGDIHRFHDHDYPRWREGHWYHGDHGGRSGWWWIAADMWYFYPAPIYPYPNPYVPPVVVEPQPSPVTAVPPPETVWYYCNSSRNYYPYVSVCPEGWRAVPAQPSDAPPR